MSQRNPMNERYTTDAKSGGSSRKSASSAKPKSDAASSVVVGSGKKSGSKTSNRDKKREAKNKQYENEKRYGDPPWKKFQIMKKLWIASLVCSVGTVALSFAVSKLEGMPEWLSMACIVAAYVFIIITLYIDLGQIRRMRKKWVAQMSAMNTKESRAEQKKARAEARAAAKAEEERKAKSAAEASVKPSSFLDKIKSFFTAK